ncbi:UbiA prenyltransferase [Mycena rosella]|uniref:UbiA prenyltransferase n=1 Tax=Mycena rosella TaxID=1033263 RepID=A0AAD7GR27_MYCRO|nr:UbiA prenyltransferase [Mycena rosella]
MNLVMTHRFSPFLLFRLDSRIMALKTDKFDYFISSAGRLFAPPTNAEIRACWELCRLHNNIGFWVVWLPTAWSIAMAFKTHPEISATNTFYYALTYVPLCLGMKSMIMTIDDLLDYDIDALVERTKDRALPRGAISLERAWCFFGLQVVVGVCLAFKILSSTALYTSMIVWPLYVIYPTCKRWTNLAPIPLGLMFNIGIFMGWSDISVDGSVPWNVLAPVYLGACLWTITYETIYQHQDKIDDIKIGINSPALLCRRYTIPICTTTALGFLCLLAYGGILNGQGISFYVGVVLGGIILVKTVVTTDIDCPAQCKAMFLTTPLVGQIVLVGFVADAVVHRYA